VRSWPPASSSRTLAPPPGLGEPYRQHASACSRRPRRIRGLFHRSSQELGRCSGTYATLLQYRTRSNIRNEGRLTLGRVTVLSPRCGSAVCRCYAFLADSMSDTEGTGAPRRQCRAVTRGRRGMQSTCGTSSPMGARGVFVDVSSTTRARTCRQLGDESCRYLPRVTSESDWAAASALATEAFGPLSAVNNAGSSRFVPKSPTSARDFRLVLAVNAVGCWLGMKAGIGPVTQGGWRPRSATSPPSGVSPGRPAFRLQREQVSRPRHDQAAAQEPWPVRHPGQLRAPGRGAHPDWHPNSANGREASASAAACRVGRSPTGRDRPPGGLPGLDESSPTRPHRVRRQRRLLSGPGSDHGRHAERWPARWPT